MSEKTSRIIMERDVPAVMRDGTVLKADIYRPAGEGKYPALLERIPYSKAFTPFATLTLDPLTAAHAGYVVIIQDVRGRFQSGGEKYYIYRDEFYDGYDSVEWAASLPYCDGNVGMFGASYMGMTQWQAAVMQPPHLKAIFPVTWATDVLGHRGGAFELGLLCTWSLAVVGLNSLVRAKMGKPDFLMQFLEMVRSIDTIEDSAFNHLPLRDMRWLELGDGFAPYITDVMDHEAYDRFHEELSVLYKNDRVTVPAFCVTGWYDALLGGSLEHYTRVKKEAGSSRASEKTRLMIGPWAHAGFLNTVGELNFGMAASGMLLELKRDLTSLQLQWFDYWLKGIENGITGEAPVKIFVMGENRWRDEQEWPLARTRYVNFYLHSGGGANSRHGDGSLSTVPPEEENADRFVYDPANPVPTTGGNILMPMHYVRGPLNQVLVEERSDVLVYYSEPLQEGLEVTGPVKTVLYAASTAPDTDFTAKLVDVHPDGKIYNLADGIIRASFRDQGEAPSPIAPGEVYRYEIDMWATSNYFKPGHRIGLEISSSNFPRFDRNTNTGDSGRDTAVLAAAEQTILHNESCPSHIILPVIPR